MDDYDSIDPSQFESVKEMRLLKFLNAAKVGNIEEMKNYLDKGWVTVDSQSPKRKETALQWSCRGESVEAVEFLIEAGANVQLEDNRRKHSLHIAVCNQTEKRLDIVKLLVKNGASLTLIDKYARSCVHWAAAGGDIDLIKTLVDAGAAISYPAVGSWQPIHEAVKGGFYDIVEFLVKRGCLDLPETKINSTPLHVAARRGHHKCVDLLLSNGVPVDIINKGLQTPLHEASYSGSARAIQSLLRAGANVHAIDNVERTPFLQSCHTGNLEAAQILLDSGSKATHDDHMGNNGLHHLLRYGSNNMENEVRQIFVDLLLQYGVSAFHKGAEEKTPLMIALANLNEDIVRIIYSSMDHPQSLKHLAKLRIRRLIGFEYDNITKTFLPTSLQSYVLASEPYFASFLEE